MAEYLIYFNQQWVGDHTDEWFRGRGPLARAVIDEIQAAGEFVFCLLYTSDAADDLVGRSAGRLVTAAEDRAPPGKR